MELKKQITTILNDVPHAKECNLTLYNALCNEYYNDLTSRYYNADNIELSLFAVIPTIEYLKLLKDNKLPTMEEVFKIRKKIKVK